MSLAIDTSLVTHVLLADGWHTVIKGSFDLDAYEFAEGNVSILKGGQAAGVTATGFTFNDDQGTTVYGPLTAVLAVRTKER